MSGTQDNGRENLNSAHQPRIMKGNNVPYKPLSSHAVMRPGEGGVRRPFQPSGAKEKIASNNNQVESKEIKSFRPPRQMKPLKDAFQPKKSNSASKPIATKESAGDSNLFYFDSQEDSNPGPFKETFRDKPSFAMVSGDPSSESWGKEDMVKLEHYESFGRNSNLNEMVLQSSKQSNPPVDFNLGDSASMEPTSEMNFTFGKNQLDSLLLSKGQKIANSKPENPLESKSDISESDLKPMLKPLVKTVKPIKSESPQTENKAPSFLKNKLLSKPPKTSSSIHTSGSQKELPFASSSNGRLKANLKISPAKVQPYRPQGQKN